MIKKILLIALFITSVSANAEAPRYAYITDEVNIPMRSSRSFGDNLVKMLTTGDKLKVIRYFDGWTQVQYGSQTGWVTSRYLSNKAPVKTRYKYLIEDNKNLKWKIIALEKKLELAKNKELLKASIQLEEDKEQELKMEDLLNELKIGYINNIASSVKKQWRYQGAKDGWGCDVYILQDQDGNVESVTTQSCNVTYLAKKKSFKYAIECAVYKSSPLPKAPIKSVFDREILFHFRVK